MLIVTWNVNSLAARADFVALFLDEVRPDVLCIQELKLETEKVPQELFASRGYATAIFGQKSWNGVLIASKTPLADVTTGLVPADQGESRLISATTSGPGGMPLRVINVYCPQGQSVDSDKFPYKLGFYDGLDAWLRATHTPDQALVLVGDLNVAPHEDDIWDPVGMSKWPSFHPEEHRRFQRLMDFGLVDAVKPHIPPKTYSFWDYRAGAFHKGWGMRIDHILVTAPVVPHVAEAWISREWRKKKKDLTPSDHAPVGVVLK
ncbi:MAG: exodeoxyribonuclease III [Myxococcota bacterium]